MIHRTTFAVEAKLVEEVFFDAKVTKAVLSFEADSWVSCLEHLEQLNGQQMTVKVERRKGKAPRILLTHEDER